MSNRSSLVCLSATTFVLRFGFCHSIHNIMITLHVQQQLLQELVQLELLCKQLYEATDTTERTKAEAALVVFSNSPDCLNKCQHLLERGDVSIFVIMS